MDQQSVTIESFLRDALFDWIKKHVDKADDSSWWKCVFFISVPFHVLASLLYLIVHPMLVVVRLAVTDADRVAFVLASTFLTFYQVPWKVFYTYIAVVSSTSLLHFLKYNSSVRHRYLRGFSWISCGTSNIFLRKFTTLHFSNPFNRCFTESQVVYFPVGIEILSKERIEVFDFPVSEHLSFDEIVGNCRIKVETLENSTGSSTVRDFYVDAPWGWYRFTINMENDNLGRLINYFYQVIETNCLELICTLVSGRFEALSILEVVKHFNSGLPLVKLELRSPAVHFIY